MKNTPLPSPVLDLDALRPDLESALAEDIGPGDVTTKLTVPAAARALARVISKADGVLAGMEVALGVLRLAGGGLRVRSASSDGCRVRAGERVLVVEGQAQGLLRGERTALNFLMRLSGIATLTARFVETVDGTGTVILDTRKTTPCWRRLEKYAVAVGGGCCHRYGLFDAVLVKENHLAFGGDLAAALAARPDGMPAIVEAESFEQYRAAAAAGAEVVLLDDFTPEEVARVHAARGASSRPLLEVSGGISLANVRAYAEAGADRISIGALTHSAPPLDLSMRIEPLPPGS